VQESLHNVAKHSGATHAAVWLSRDSDDLELQIVDHGVGFLPPAGELSGLGLVSIRERASFAGGRVAIHSRPGAGTTVSVRVPIVLTRQDLVFPDGDRRSA